MPLRVFLLSAAIVIIGENPDYNDCDNYPDPYAGAEDSVGVVAATAGVTAVGIIVAEVTHLLFHLIKSAAAVVMAAVGVITAIVVVHKEKNHKDDEPQYCAVFSAAAVSVSK